LGEENTVSADPNKEKDELLKGLEEAEREAKRIEDTAKDALQNARLVRDTAPQLRILYQEIPVSGLSAQEWARQNQNVQLWLGVAKSMPPTVTEVSTFAALSQAVTNTAMSGVMVPFPLRLPPSPPAPPTPSPHPLAVQQATERLAAIVEKYPSMDQARAEIRRLGLDTRGGDSKSPLQLLEESRVALDMPVSSDGGATGVLLGLRGCINACVSELIRRRPVQEEAKTWKAKVASLGRHCGRTGLGTAHFDNLGIEAEAMNDRLSAGKDKGVNRPEVQQLFTQGLLFLVSMLTSIDESKLRPK
jgi:hypothetical protein